MDVTATSSSDDGNVAANVLDDKPSTRWSASGEQWLQLDLGTTQTLTGASFVFYKGDKRSAIFDIETSVDGADWDIQLEGLYSSGNSTDAEAFYFSNNIEAQYVRYIGYGNDSSSSSSAKWNSLIEAKVLVENADTDTDTETDTEIYTDTEIEEVVNSPITSLTVVSVSAEQSSNTADNLFDDNSSNTSGVRWSAQGLQSEPQWVVIDMGATYNLSQVTLFPYSSRAYQYKIEVSALDDADFTTVVDRTNNSESATSLTDTVESSVTGRYLRLEVQGANDYSGNWASVNELKIEGHQE